MADIVLIYASLTGNTEEMADAIVSGLRSQGAEVVVKSVMDANASELERYDGIVLGAYTWGDGELPDEFLDFYEEMDDIKLTGRRAAAFGSCDSCYPEYGAAVDLLIGKLKEAGADIVLPGLKIELSPNAEDAEACKQFGSEFAKLVAKEVPHS
ncbi:flavodoxin [Cohnella cellulosilytica]|uniref:Flavodoxin n=1 Tax=Cohnella cellulosilytica TaxID=986710 RepID=A0ABW2FFT0_9BACL